MAIIRGFMPLAPSGVLEPYRFLQAALERVTVATAREYWWRSDTTRAYYRSGLVVIGPRALSDNDYGLVKTLVHELVHSIQDLRGLIALTSEAKRELAEGTFDVREDGTLPPDHPLEREARAIAEMVVQELSDQQVRRLANWVRHRVPDAL